MYNLVHVFSMGIKVLIWYLLRFIQSTDVLLAWCIFKVWCLQKRFPKGFFNPAIPTKKCSLIPEIPTVNTGRSQSWSFCGFFLVHHIILKGPFRWVRIFSIGIDPLKSLLTVTREFTSFPQSNDMINFRSFQSFTRVKYTSHCNDFLPFNYDQGNCDVHIKTDQYQGNE